MSRPTAAATGASARLQEPVLTKALTRFRYRLDLGRRPGAAAEPRGRRDRLRAAVVPQLRAVRGTRSIYHNNAIQTWQVNPNGEVWNVQVA